MKKVILIAFALFLSLEGYTQTNPTILKWLQNTSLTGSYYMSGSSTALPNSILVNCQKVEYSSNWVYVHTKGVPSYPTGPFLDGNPSNASDQNAIFKFPLNPVKKTGTQQETNAGNIGVFVNGVALFDYRDGVAWDSASNALCGGPGKPPCPGGMGSKQAWNRDAIPAEMKGFDCSKGHPANGNYHHHQNPSAFKLDKIVVSTICNLYDADGLYTIDPTKHSPLIGFAYDGFPIYGAYGYKNTDGTGGITRIKSGYQYRSITTRTTHASGAAVVDGPPISTTYPIGYFREDYEFVPHTGSADYLDSNNGRFCVTPEYPSGIYCYFATVDTNHNSIYPYIVGPYFYGDVTAAKVTSVTETTTTYTSPLSISKEEFGQMSFSIIPNPATNLIAVQVNGLVTADIAVELFDLTGKKINNTTINKGQTIAYFDVQTLYDGMYFVKISNSTFSKTEKILVRRN